MHLLQHWFSRAAERVERVRFIEDALLTRRYGRYAFFRLRYFFGISMAEAAIHIIEVTILAFIFTRQTLVLAILVRTVGGLGSAWWWGALEGLRGEIRNLRRQGKSHRIDAIASKWMRLAILVATIIGLGTFIWIALDTNRPLGRFTVFHLFVLAVAVQLALSILSRTYHSIVYAVRRVYRPFTAILLVRLFAFSGTILIWPLLGAWSFPMMLLATSLLASGLTFYYVGRMYRMLGFKPLRLTTGIGSLRLLRLLTKRRTWLAGFAFVVVRLDILIILLLFPAAYNSPSDYNLFLFFYLISPLVHSGYGWAYLFYFDLKRLETGLLINLRKDFDRFVRGLAWWMGGLFGAVACIVGTLLMQRNLGMLYLLLMLFFVCRSRLAFAQVRFFTEHRYGALIAMGATLIATVQYAQHAIPGDVQRFGFYTAALLLVMLLTTPVAARASSRQTVRGLLSFPDWLAAVRGMSGRIRIRSLDLARDATDFQVAYLATGIQRAISRFGAMARIRRRRIAWFESADGAGVLSDESLVRSAGGLVQGMKNTGLAGNGMQAFVEAQQLGIIDKTGRCQQRGDDTPYDVPALQRKFRRMFPGGVVFDLQRDGERAGDALSPAECRDIMFNAVKYSRDFSPPAREAQFDVSTLLVDGEIRLIFAIPMKNAVRARRQWRTQIDKVNLALACGGGITA